MKISIDQLLGMNYIRYDRLLQMVIEAFKGSDANTINIYIDLYSMFKPLYNNQIYDIENYTKVTSNVINICAHYRDFFRTRGRVESKIFLVYSKNTPYVNNQFYPNYNGKNELLFNSNKLVDDMIQNNIELLETLCPYLPDIHFVKGTFETPVIIYDLICKNEAMGDTSPNIVITKDNYSYQLPAIRDNITIFRPKKKNGEDVSYFVNNKNVLHTYLLERKIKIEDKYFTLMPGLLSLIMALSSSQERNIKTLCNIKTTMNLLIDSISNHTLINGYNADMNIVWNALDNSKIKTSNVSFEFRFKAIDIIFQHLVFMDTIESKDIRLVNLYDPETVKTINNKYFIENPLDLNRL